MAAPRALVRHLARVTAPISMTAGPYLELQKTSSAALRVVTKWLTACEKGNIALEKYLRIEAVLALRRSQA
jgi:hypothetical protein